MPSEDQDDPDLLYLLGMCDNIMRCGRWVLVPRPSYIGSLCPHCRSPIGFFTEVSSRQVRGLMNHEVQDVMGGRSAPDEDASE